MTWHVGIDEAGYGPNLGPLVMTLAACRTDSEDADLWTRMALGVRRPEEDDDGRLPVGDSKQVYQPSKGLACLERSVLSCLHGQGDETLDRPVCLAELLSVLLETSRADMNQEPWFQGETRPPVCGDHEGVQGGTVAWRRASAAGGVTWGAIRSVAIGAGRFNALVQRWGNKAAVLGIAWTELIGCLADLPGDDAVLVFVDKHGGRNFYAALVQHGFPDGMVVAREEGALRSEYHILGLPREVRVVFQPRADATCFNVALGSMVSKYLREVLMEEFNGFWRKHVPGVKPTAGYPGDASRFLADIQPALKKLSIPQERIWRER